MGKISECAKSVSNADYDDSFFGKSFAIEFHFSSVAPLKTSAIVPYKDRQLLISSLGWCPYVKIQAVFVHRYFRINMPFSAVQICTKSRSILYRNRTKFKGI